MSFDSYFCQLALTISIAGACRKEELTNLILENFKDEGLVFHIQIQNTKIKISREFFVTVGDIQRLYMEGNSWYYVLSMPTMEQFLLDTGQVFVE